MHCRCMWNKKCKFLLIIVLRPHSPVVTVGNNWALDFYSICIYIHTCTYTEAHTHHSERSTYIGRGRHRIFNRNRIII